FAMPAPDLDAKQLRDFSFGNRLFNTNWVQAGASVASFDGLGPMFNRVSCSGCHVRDGRGRPPEAGAPMDSMLVRISVPGRSEHGGPKSHPVYGDQIQDRAIPGVEPEAVVVLTWEEIGGKYEDGTPYSLRRPRIAFDQPAYGALPKDLLTSPRTAQSMIGLGLLEAVPAETILAMADPGDANRDGVSGRGNRVWDASRGAAVLGRFGWKANQPSLRAQVTGAAAGDIGITSSVAPHDACSEAQKACRTAPNGGAPELSDEFLEKLLLYTRTLAVPYRRHFDDPRVVKGEALFAGAGCPACHVPTLKTGTHELAALADQTIHPFTDLLVHDMGEGLADGRPDFEAGGSEWRTSPLWGLGLIPDVNGHELLLHDGRARGPAEAILWHGGEAEAAKESFRKMPKDDREALVAFLRSL
ncbi:MAG TPA: di-heme oxidoredictase family protein, partial [Nevskiaceae bacterium]|nr:di-heme oxidoredictase family protein [Nevskiaceae bacterium]